MTEYFSILLSAEVEEFLDNIEEKARNKILYNIDKAKITLDPKIFKNLLKKYGNLGHSMVHYNIDYLHFGTKEIIKTHLLLQRMEL